MRDPNDSLGEAVTKTNAWVSYNMLMARLSEADGDDELAMMYFGAALHTIQDSSSPAHRCFQKWQDNPGLIREWEHVKQEYLFSQAAKTSVISDTRKLYDMFIGNTQMPNQFFDPKTGNPNF